MIINISLQLGMCADACNCFVGRSVFALNYGIGCLTDCPVNTFFTCRTKPNDEDGGGEEGRVNINIIEDGKYQGGGF